MPAGPRRPNLVRKSLSTGARILIAIAALWAAACLLAPPSYAVAEAPGDPMGSTDTSDAVAWARQLAMPR